MDKVMILVGLFIIVSSGTALIKFDSFSKDNPRIKKHTLYPCIGIGVILVWFGL